MLLVVTLALLVIAVYLSVPDGRLWRCALGKGDRRIPFDERERWAWLRALGL
jgi:hypothetical protein